jgi:hypothetical protein
MFETRESDISSSISKFFEKNEDFTQLLNFLNTEEETEIYELRIGPKKLTSKIKKYNIKKK